MGFKKPFCMLLLTKYWQQKKRCQTVFFTPWKINMEPENGGLEDGVPFHSFSIRWFWGVPQRVNPVGWGGTNGTCAESTGHLRRTWRFFCLPPVFQGLVGDWWSRLVVERTSKKDHEGNMPRIGKKQSTFQPTWCSTGVKTLKYYM